MVEFVAAILPGWQVEGFGGDTDDNVVVATNVEGDWEVRTFSASDCQAAG